MTKYAAFGATIGIGTQQVETATVVGTIVNPGNATVVTTCAGMTGSPITTSVAVLAADTADTVAEKIRTALGGVANITALFSIGGSGARVVLKRLTAAANVANLNVSIDNGTCTGLTAAPTSADTTAGVASVNIAQVKSIGHGLSLDTEDVTTHDSTDAYEEVVATILRSGEVSLELVYDPNGATHSAGSGLLDYYENKKLGFITLTFVTGYVWSFPAYVTNFEPSAEVDGALTASVTLKVTGKPTLV